MPRIRLLIFSALSRLPPYGSEAADRIDELLGELSAADASAGVRWENIIGIWTSDELGKPLNYGVLPDGLPDTDELCIVVLGFQLEPDGSMKDELVNRLTVALRCAEKYPRAYIAPCTLPQCYPNHAQQFHAFLNMWGNHP